MKTNASIRPSHQDCQNDLLPMALAVVMVLALEHGPSTVFAADVKSCFLRKSQGFTQSGPGALVPWSATPFGFWADVYTDSSDAVTNASLVLTDGSSKTLTWSHEVYRPSSYTWKENFTNAPSLEAAYAAGNYTFNFDTTNDGSNNIPLNLPAGSFPNAPCVSNFSAAQNVDPAGDFLLQWTPFLGAAPADDINVELWPQSAPYTMAFKAPTDPLFSGTNTSIVIPRNTLAPGLAYYGFLVFRSISDRDTNSYPGVACTAAYDTFTFFRLHTLASPVLQIGIGQTNVTLSWPSVFAGFVPEAASNLAPFPDWLPVTNNPVVSNSFYAVTLPRSNAGVFYHLIKK